MSFVSKRASLFPDPILIAIIVGSFMVFVGLGARARQVDAGPGPGGNGQLTVFSNPAPIAPVDRPSNNAGTNPGIPAVNYPSPIVDPATTRSFETPGAAQEAR